MPAGIVEDEDYELVPTGTYGSRERCQDDAQEIGVDRGADEPNHRPAARVDEAVEIEPLEPVLAEGDQALPFRACCGLVGSVLAAGPFWCGVVEGRADHARSLFS
jgi:hypothetical protein